MIIIVTERLLDSSAVLFGDFFLLAEMSSKDSMNWSKQQQH